MAWATEADFDQARSLAHDVVAHGRPRDLLALLAHIRGSGEWDADRVRDLLACASGVAAYAVDPTGPSTQKAD